MKKLFFLLILSLSLTNIYAQKSIKKFTTPWGFEYKIIKSTETTKFEYDENGVLIHSIDDLFDKTFSYYPNGNIYQKKCKTGNESYLTIFDEKGKIIEESYFINEEMINHRFYKYDENSNLIYKNIDGTETWYKYIKNGYFKFNIENQGYNYLLDKNNNIIAKIDLINDIIDLEPDNKIIHVKSIIEEDENDEETWFYYNSDGTLQHVKNISAYGTSKEIWISNDLIVKKTSFNSEDYFSETIEYDNYGNKTKSHFEYNDEITDTIYQYLPNKIISYNTSNGTRSINEYDKNNKLISFIQYDKNDFCTTDYSYTYDSYGEQNTCYDNITNTYIFKVELDSNNNPIHIIDTYNQKEIYYENVYNGENELIQKTKYIIDKKISQPKIKKIIKTENSISYAKITNELIYKYDENGKLIYQKSSDTINPFEIWYYYNSHGDLIYYTNHSSCNLYINYDYNSNDKLIHSKTSDGDEQWYNYNEKGELISFKTNNGVINYYTTINNETLITKRIENNYERTYEYNEKGILIHYKDSLGNEQIFNSNGDPLYYLEGEYEETYKYDENGNVIFYANNNGDEEHYDANGNYLYIKSGDYISWNEYDENDNKIYHNDIYGEEIVFEYNSLGDRTTEKYNSGYEYYYVYNKNGDLIKEYDSNNTVFFIREFDENNNVIYSNEDDIESWYSYDNQNRIINYKDNTGLETIYSYDDSNNTHTETDIQYIYDDENNLISSKTIEYRVYNSFEKTTYLKNDNEEFFFEYDKDGKLILSTYINENQKIRFDSDYNQIYFYDKEEKLLIEQKFDSENRLLKRIEYEIITLEF